MKKGLWHKRIPTVAALIILFGSIWVTSFLIQTGVILVGRASPNKTPQNVSVSNITDTSFTVSFTTNDQVLTGISVEEENSPQSFVVYDNRNKQTNERNEYYSHYITVPDLKPQTTYYFSILSDGQAYLDDNEQYSILTGGPIIGSPPDQNPIVGNIVLPDGSPANDTIVTLLVDGANLISALTDDAGQYIIPTNSLRQASGNAYFTLETDEKLTIEAVRQGMKTSVITTFSELIPTITLEQRYDFTRVSTQETATGASELTIPTPQVAAGTIRILTPSVNQSFVDARPSFRGTALPRRAVNININTVLNETVESDGNGIWIFRPNEAIPSGGHTLNIETSDRFGIMQSVSQEFTIFSGGSQVAETATPSATPIITAAPTIEPTQAPEPTISVSQPTPTEEEPTPNPSPTIQTEPTISVSQPTPTIFTQPTTPLTTSIPTSPPNITPEPPGSASAIALTIVSVILIFAGGALLFIL